MNALFPRFLRLAYRKEPISSFILIVGAVDAVIGGVGGRWTLLSFGLIMLLLAGLVRWLQIQKAQTILAEEKARYYLPPASSHTPLPMLLNDKTRR